MTTDDFPQPTMTTQTIENRRALLRQALEKRPDDARLTTALKRSLKPSYIRKAAGRGVFVCYSPTDAVIALDLYTDLRAQGIPAWMDEVEVTDEAEWGKIVGNALRGCGLLLLLLSEEALTNAEVQAERVYFLRKGKVILPLLLDDCDVSDQQLLLDPLDFTGDYAQGLAALLPLLSDEAGV